MLAYSSNEHGVSLTTFFNRVDKYEPTILVIRTSDMEVITTLDCSHAVRVKSSICLQIYSCPQYYTNPSSSPFVHNTLTSHFIYPQRCLEHIAQQPGLREIRKMIKVCRILNLLKHTTTNVNKIVVFRHATKVFRYRRDVPVQVLEELDADQVRVGEQGPER